MSAFFLLKEKSFFRDSTGSNVFKVSRCVVIAFGQVPVRVGSAQLSKEHYFFRIPSQVHSRTLHSLLIFLLNLRQWKFDESLSYK
jgi:hypothetical protein